MSNDNRDGIAGQTVRGSIYSIIASSVTLGLGFVRFILLLKFLLPGDFGVFTQALLFIALAALLRLPGLDPAFVQRHHIEEPDRRTYFTLKMALLGGNLLLMVGLTYLVITPAYPDMPLLGSVLVALLAIEIIKGLNSVQEAILTRDLSFRVVAGADILSAVASTIVAPYMAWQGFGAWSLVGERLSGQIARTIALWGLFARPWRPRFGWKKETARGFWDFSVNLWGTAVLNFVVDRFDDFWIGRNLGQQALGYYSRAYEFAHYPRRVIANPILSVFYSTYSRLQTDRLRLSRAFFRATSLMVRTSFFFSLIFVLNAPEFIALLGDKWLPMLATFQLMIVYTLFDPLSLGASNLLIATGHPEYVVRTRLFQVVIFVPAVMILGGRFGIEGVAVAANVMIFVGTVILFWLTHRFVDYSSRRLWLWPVVGLVVTVTAVVLVIELLPGWSDLSVWSTLAGKTMVITAVYGGLLWLVERTQLKASWETIWSFIAPVWQQWRKRS